MSFGTVLLVDDDAAIREYVRDVLEPDGFVVLEAGDGVAALAIMESAPQLIEMLVTDIDMPGIDGIELARRVQTVRPGTSVLYMSGSPPGELEVRGLESAPCALLTKPFRPEVLLERVRLVARQSTTAISAGSAIGLGDGPVKCRPPELMGEVAALRQRAVDLDGEVARATGQARHVGTRMSPAGLARELNGPLSVLVLRLDLILLEAEEHALAPPVREDLTVLHRHLSRLVRVLASARLEAGLGKRPHCPPGMAARGAVGHRLGAEVTTRLSRLLRST